MAIARPSEAIIGGNVVGVAEDAEDRAIGEDAERGR